MADIKILDLTTATEITETTDYIPVVDTSDTAQDSTGTTKKATVRKLLGDRVLPDTIVGTTETQTLSNKTLTSPVINTPTGDVVTPTGTQTLTNKTLTSPVVTDVDITGGSVTDVDITGGSATDIDITGGSISESTNVVEVLKKVYPVGCIYTSTVSTNPNTLFGFGTWSEYGQGRVLVGKSAEAEFNTAGKTGGAKTHTLTTAEMPAHRHPMARADGGETYQYSYKNNIGHPTSGVAYTESAGSGSAHNNLQPYIVVYFWKRTA